MKNSGKMAGAVRLFCCLLQGAEADEHFRKMLSRKDDMPEKKPQNSRWRKWKYRIPGILIAASALLNIGARFSKGFADAYVRYVFPIWVETYGRLTGLFSFSVGEWMLYLAAVLVCLLILGGILLGIAFPVKAWMARTPLKLTEKVRKTASTAAGTAEDSVFPAGGTAKDSVSAGGRIFVRIKRGYAGYAFFLYWVLGVVSVIMTLNCFLLYQVSPMPLRYQIGGDPGKEYGREEITALRDYVVEQANGLSGTFERDECGAPVCRGDMKEQARQEMGRLGETFSGLGGYYPRPKELCLSGFYSQQYIMGYYFPFSMEANYNRQMYITNMPATMCHELSHLKGFILEDEANFVGYLACEGSEDPFFRYSAYLSVIGYLDRDFMNAIGRDEEVYSAHPGIAEQVLADKKFLTPQAWEQVEERALISTETVKQAADAFLETNLTMNGVEDGTISYSRVVDLLLQYYDGKLY